MPSHLTYGRFLYFLHGYHVHTSTPQKCLAVCRPKNLSLTTALGGTQRTKRGGTKEGGSIFVFTFFRFFPPYASSKGKNLCTSSTDDYLVHDILAASSSRLRHLCIRSLVFRFFPSNACFALISLVDDCACKACVILSSTRFNY